jgi:hypothetical protein
MAGLIIGVKAVFLYLKQSPLPTPQASAADWSKLRGVAGLGIIIPATLLLSGCVSSWEQDAYAALASSKVLIDCAVAGYNHFNADIRHACAADPNDPAFDPSRFYLPQTREVQQSIEKARHVQVAAVEAFAAYAVVKVGKDRSVALSEKQALVVSYLEQLPILLSAVRNLIGNRPGVTRGPAAVVHDPMAAIAGLKPAYTLRF